MSTVIRHRHTHRRELGAYKIYELLTGEIFYPVQGYTGYGDGQSTDAEDYISEEMRLDWLANREELLDFWRSGKYTLEYWPPEKCKPWLFVRGDPDILPWAAQFDEYGFDENGFPHRPSA